MKKLIVLVVTFIVLLSANVFSVYADTASNQPFTVECTANYWDVNIGLGGDSLYTPYLKLKITNNKSTDASQIIVKVIFTNESEKSVWSEETSYVISGSDSPLKTGYNKTAYIKSSVGYKSQISEYLLPSILAEVYVNNTLYGSIKVEKTFSANTCSLFLESYMEKSDPILPNVESAGFGSVEGEIQFRGIPWGTSYTTFATAMENWGAKSRDYSSYDISSWEMKFSAGEIAASYNFDDNSGFYYYGSGEELKVAGLPISNVRAQFLYSYDESSVYYEQDKSNLYKAWYNFNVADTEQSYDLLINKLTSLYGNGKESEDTYFYTWGSKTYYSKCYDWIGKNSTGVSLRHEWVVTEKGEIDSDSLWLCYGKTNSKQLFDNMKNAIARDQINTAINAGNDGL